VFNPAGKPVPMQSNPEMSLQIGSSMPTVPSTPRAAPAAQRVQPGPDGILNYIALHEATAPTTFANLNTEAARLDFAEFDNTSARALPWSP